jgi:asparagine synthase (glutamine-hydrolysing)
MCGIAGVFIPGGAAEETLEQTAGVMSAAVRHRGPDGAGVWVDAAAGIALGHRRLRVVELSELGDQPMQCACGRYFGVFNGEIYNFRTLRRELESRGQQVRGGSDTEVLLAAICEWGVEGALARCVGAFALAVWDRLERRLYLARDRAGEKPLYYGRLERSFVFGSELGALEAQTEDAGAVDRIAVGLYLRFGYVPAPFSIYTRVRKLPPASIVVVNSAGEVSAPVRYWCGETSGTADIPEAEAIDQLDSLLNDAVGLQTIADVPVGAFLSGGIDSATLVALMCRHARRVKTFTIGFEEPRYDESAYARAVARCLGTDHTEMRVTAADAMAVIPKLPAIWSEPFADASQIPTYLVSALARREVTVALSGDGGDELFGGYDRYSWATGLWRCMRVAPHGVRGRLARGIMRLPLGDKVHKVAELLDAADPGELYLRLVSNWLDQPVERRSWVSSGPFAEWMMRRDFATYLPDDILVKVDRASMANGLESRAPFLDHRVVEFAQRLPLRFKVRNGQGKWVLRQVLDKYVPRRLVDRPKAGFAIPLRVWIRGPLREWAEELISESRLRREGFFQPEPVRRMWQEHLSGARNRTAPLWTVLAFQAWYEQKCAFKIAAAS